MIKQLSIFIENKPGRLAFVTKVMAEAGVDIRALSIADTADFGILRLIVDDPKKAADEIKKAGFALSLTEVIGVRLEDEPGALYRVLDVLQKNDISVEYTYAFITRDSTGAYVILRVASNEKAIKILEDNGIELIAEENIYNI